MKLIPYNRQKIDHDDVEAVTAALYRNFLTQGNLVDEFEENLKAYVKCKYVVSCNSCTSALHMALFAMDLVPGSVVWISNITFAATANVPAIMGARLEFLDIEMKTGNVCIDALEKRLSSLKKEDYPDFLIVVHMCGNPVNMSEIARLFNGSKTKIIEDAAHGLGATYLNKNICNPVYSDVAITSFHPVKMVTTAEGGALFTNNSELAEKARLFKSHGISRKYESEHGDHPWYYCQNYHGLNYRMADLNAALGISQLKKLDMFVLKRKELADYYINRISELKLPLKVLEENPEGTSSWHLFVVKLAEGTNREKRDRFMEYLRSLNISVNLHYIPLNKQKVFDKYTSGSTLEHSQIYFNVAVSLPLFVDLAFEDIDYILEVASNFFAGEPIENSDTC